MQLALSGVMALSVADLQEEADPWPVKALASEFDKQLVDLAHGSAGMWPARLRGGALTGRRPVGLASLCSDSDFRSHLCVTFLHSSVITGPVADRDPVICCLAIRCPDQARA
jgi:hypothetical protein